MSLPQPTMGCLLYRIFYPLHFLDAHGDLQEVEVPINEGLGMYLAETAPMKVEGLQLNSLAARLGVLAGWVLTHVAGSDIRGMACEAAFDLLATAKRGALSPIPVQHQAPPQVQTSPRASFDCFLSHAWGAGRATHNQVVDIARGLQARGLRVWLDEDQLRGNILNSMAEGIANSRVFVAFLTAEYLQKVASGDHCDNCWREFNFAANSRGAKLLAVPMEANLLAPDHWSGPVAMILGGNLYPAEFAGGLSAAQMDRLAEAIRVA